MEQIIDVLLSADCCGLAASLKICASFKIRQGSAATALRSTADQKNWIFSCLFCICCATTFPLSARERKFSFFTCAMYIAEI